MFWLSFYGLSCLAFLALVVWADMRDPYPGPRGLPFVARAVGAALFWPAVMVVVCVVLALTDEG